MIGLPQPVPFDPARKHWRQWPTMLRDAAVIYTVSARKRWDADGRGPGWRRRSLWANGLLSATVLTVPLCTGMARVSPTGELWFSLSNRWRLASACARLTLALVAGAAVVLFVPRPFALVGILPFLALSCGVVAGGLAVPVLTIAWWRQPQPKTSSEPRRPPHGAVTVGDVAKRPGTENAIKATLAPALTAWADHHQLTLTLNAVPRLAPLYQEALGAIEIGRRRDLFAREVVVVLVRRPQGDRDQP